MVRLIYILRCAEEVATNNVLFTYDEIKKWFSICDTLKQVSNKKCIYKNIIVNFLDLYFQLKHKPLKVTITVLKS